MSSPSQPALCEVDPHAVPCGELIALRDKVSKQDRRINAAIDEGSETAQALKTVADRVGVMRADGTSTPHSLTSAVQVVGTEIMSLKRIIEDRLTSQPPAALYGAIDDDPVTEITRHDIQRPVFTSRRLRSVSRQRNWIAIGAAVAGMGVGAFEVLKALGVFK